MFENDSNTIKLHLQRNLADHIRGMLSTIYLEIFISQNHI
jgi:hypothetical protein